MITTIVMVKVAANRIPEVAEAIADLEGVREVYSVAGDVDLIAIVRVREFDQIADVIAGRLSRVEGVLGTDTHVAFRAYSRHDLESAFSIGYPAPEQGSALLLGAQPPAQLDPGPQHRRGGPVVDRGGGDRQAVPGRR